MKKWIALLLTSCLVLSLTACGSKNDGENTSTTASNVSQQTGSTDTAGNTEATEPAAPEVVSFEGDFTYKDWVGTLASNWSPHTYQNTDDNYLTDYIRAGLYTFVFNDELHPVEGREPFEGYKIVPEMAAGDPVDVTEKVKAEHPEFNIPASATAGYAYTIDLNPDATWQDGTKINADTYVYSMKQLLDPKLLNYRASDYYSGNMVIAGAENYANSGNTVKKPLSTDGETIDLAFADLVKGEDGVYTTPEGYPVYFGLKETFAYLAGDTLETYAELFPPEALEALQAAADDEGWVPVTDDSIASLYAFIGSDNWGNEPEENLAYYAAYDYTYSEVDFSTVGLYKTGDYQITIVFGKLLQGFNLYYNLTSNWIVYEDLYESCKKKDGDAWSTTYNTSVDTTMSYGPYKLVSYQQDKALRLERNENWYGYTDGKHTYVDPTDGLTYPMYQTTAIDCSVVAEAATAKLMFLKGELVRYGLQAEDFATYRNSEYAYATPQETIFFLIFNGYKEAIDGREASGSFDQTKSDLQTMTLKSFRQAVAVTYDKELFASTISPARSGGYGLVGNSYIYDPDTGAKYRDSDPAKKALCDFYSVDVSAYSSLDEAVNSITGYDPVTAKELYKQAFDEAIKAGFITDADGDGISDQTVTIEYCMSADSDFMTQTIDYLNEKMAEVTKGTPFEGKVQFTKSAPYGNDWSNKIRSGLSDTVLAGWSGSALDPFGLSDLYVNPAKQYDAQWFNASAQNMTLDVNGESVTLNLKQWSDALNGLQVTAGGKDYNFGEGVVDIETRLNILAGIESAVLQTYDYIPMLQDASMMLLSQQVYFVIEEYNPILSRGGVPYMKYNYNDSEWADYVASQGGELKY